MTRKRLRWSVLPAAMALFGCASVVPLATDESGWVEASILVFSETDNIIEHAEAFAVFGGRIERVGATSESRLVARIPRELFSGVEGALLVCAEGYYCGGWRAGDVELSRTNSEPLDIHITLAAIRLWNTFLLEAPSDR